MGTLNQLVIDWAQVSLLSLATGFLYFEAGVLNLGNAGALLAGAYCVAFLGLGTVGWLPAVGLSFVVLVWLASSSLRVRGDIFAVVSLALAEALRYTALGAYEVTKGSLGLGPLPSTWLSTDAGAMFASLAVLVTVVAAYAWLVRGWPGLVLGTIRDNELVARGMGFSTQTVRFLAVALCGLAAMASGWVQAGYYGFAYPSMGRLEVSLMAFAAVKLASPFWRQGRPLWGIAGQLGGTAVIVALPPILRWTLPGSVDVALLRQIVFGSLLYVLVMPSDLFTRTFGTARLRAARGGAA